MEENSKHPSERKSNIPAVLPCVREKSGNFNFFQGQGIVREFCKLSGKFEIWQMSYQIQVQLMSEFIIPSFFFFCPVINQMVSSSAFYVELCSDWRVVVINDFPKYKNCLI